MRTSITAIRIAHKSFSKLCYLNEVSFLERMSKCFDLSNPFEKGSGNYIMIGTFIPCVEVRQLLYKL